GIRQRERRELLARRRSGGGWRCPLEDLARLRLANISRGVIRQQKTVRDRLVGGLPHRRDIRAVGAVALLERQPRIVVADPFRFRLGKGNPAALESTAVSGEDA